MKFKSCRFSHPHPIQNNDLALILLYQFIRNLFGRGNDSN